MKISKEIITESETQIESFGFSWKVCLIGGETSTIDFKEARLKENRSNTIGELIGHIEIIYPFAGFELKLTLEISNELVDEDLNIIDGVIKIPFVENKVSLYDLFSYRENLLEEIFMDLQYDKCSCGGYMMPMYDEFPNWITFCSKCDGRHENVENSPIKEPTN